jgi:hypothetical protein
LGFDNFDGSANTGQAAIFGAACPDCKGVYILRLADLFMIILLVASLVSLLVIILLKVPFL